ncbi:hypothetical protein HDU89_007652 [Geranomyces variabilis]|nr:hypothetical protein HDU89_007652 [Geranomyces variabilis]
MSLDLFAPAPADPADPPDFNTIAIERVAVEALLTGIRNADGLAAFFAAHQAELNRRLVEADVELAILRQEKAELKHILTSVTAARATINLEGEGHQGESELKVFQRKYAALQEEVAQLKGDSDAAEPPRKKRVQARCDLKDLLDATSELEATCENAKLGAARRERRDLRLTRYNDIIDAIHRTLAHPLKDWFCWNLITWFLKHVGRKSDDSDRTFQSSDEWNAAVE